MIICSSHPVKQYSLIALILISTSVMAQKKVDLAAIKFNENPDALLKGVASKKTTEGKTTYYELAKPQSFPYQGVRLEASVTIDAFQHQVISYTAESNLTATTNRVIKALLTTYHQPTKKLNDHGDTRAWYWQTPTLFIQLMTTEVGFHDKRGKQISCKLRVITLKALKSGAEPDFLEIYKVFSTYKV
jgi:hypothetical protein